MHLAADGEPAQLHQQQQVFLTGGVLIPNGPAPAHAAAFNLGSGQRTALNDLINLLAESLGTRVKKTVAPAAKGDVPDTLADITFAQEALSYQPKVPIQDGIPKFVQWWREQ